MYSLPLFLFLTHGIEVVVLFESNFPNPFLAIDFDVLSFVIPIRCEKRTFSLLLLISRNHSTLEGRM